MEGAENKGKKNSTNEVDLVFVCDCTASMSPFIQEVQRNISAMIEKIQASEARDVRFGLICYRDHPPQESTYVTKTYDFTKSVTKAKSYVNEMQAVGGGDIPEAVAAGLFESLQLNWRKSATKIVVIIADAPPHGLGKHQPGDAFPNGDPSGDIMAAVWQMSGQGIIIYSIGCTIISQRAFAREWYQAISAITGGRYISLENAKILADVVIGGAEEELALEDVSKQIDEETSRVEKEMEDKGEKITEDDVCAEVTQRLQSRGVEVNTLMVDQTAADKQEDLRVVELLKGCQNLEQVREILDNEPGPLRQPYKSTNSRRKRKRGAMLKANTKRMREDEYENEDEEDKDEDEPTAKKQSCSNRSNAISQAQVKRVWNRKSNNKSANTKSRDNVDSSNKYSLDLPKISSKK